MSINRFEEQKEIFSRIVDESLLSMQEQRYLAKLNRNSNTTGDLEKCWKTLREKIIMDSAVFDAQNLRTPELSKSVKDANFDFLKTDYVYERGMNYPAVESMYNVLARPVGGNELQSSTYLFSSGMAAITTLLTTIAKVFFLGYSKRVLIFGTYFETRDFLRSLSDDYTVSYVQSSKDFVRELLTDEYSLVYIEPIAWSVHLKLLDMRLVDDAVNKSPLKNLRFIIFDSTLSGVSQFVLPNFVHKLATRIPLMIFNITSLIKLSEFGMELFNGGMIQLFTSPRFNLFKELTAVTKKLLSFRSKFGTSMSRYALRIAEQPFMTDLDLQRKYAARVKTNSEILSENLLQISNPKEVSISRTKGTSIVDNSPFVLISLKGKASAKRDYLILLSKIVNRLDMGQPIIAGTSFGFHMTRADIIEYDSAKSIYFLRLSAGAFISDPVGQSRMISDVLSTK